LSIKAAQEENDLDIFQEMYQRFNSGFLIWCNAGDDNQFHSQRAFWTAEDIFLVRPVDSYRPEWWGGVYSDGMPIKTKLKEVTR
jgi:hypothetical protein